MPLASSEPPQTLLARFTSYGTQGVSGAGFTTFDALLGGSLESPNGINANNYVAKDRVYMSGGPVAAGLEDGTYYFAVLTPGAENGGFIDGAAGNLSDTQVGGTAGDNGSGDDISNRTFTVVNHQITEYAGTHARGTSPNGQPIIGLAPFDDTKNAANMLSVQLAAMALNVQHGFVNGEGIIFAPGTSGANANGFSSVNAVIAEATAALAADGQPPSQDPNRTYQEALKNALDQANNNVNFVLQPSQVPTPQFP